MVVQFCHLFLQKFKPKFTMKKLFAMFTVVVVFTACGSGENKAAKADSMKMADSIKMADSMKMAAAMDTAKKAMDTAHAAMDTAKAKKM